MNDCWQLGASFKSPQWFERFQFHTVDNLGNPRQASFRADLPLITSLGVGYTGFDRWLLAADVRYTDFGNTAGLGTSGYDATGAVRGLGFRSTVSVALGAQYQLTEAVSLRLGYSFNQNPIPDSESSFNVASPTIVEHVVYVGASYNVSNALKLSLGYAHAFQNSIDGPLVTPLGALPGTSIRNTVSADTFIVEVQQSDIKSCNLRYSFREYGHREPTSCHRHSEGYPMPKTVAILGGGVAGMKAAHELIQRGFKVAVYELQEHIAGGKARSLPVPNSGTQNRPNLPAEHGFRFFPGFYRHLPDTMQRIPFDGKWVIDNLTDAKDTLLVRPGRDFVYAPTKFPSTLEELSQASEAFVAMGKTFGIPMDEVLS